jgi:glycosyltransferase involved in cell wall biosynthesis
MKKEKLLVKTPKILAWCDTPTVPTGFGIVVKNLFRDLHIKYDLEILGINYHGDTRYDTSKWFIYPASQYPDVLGFKKMEKVIPAVKPDVLILFQDIFHINEAWEKIKKLAPKAKIIIYFPIDGTPVNITWKTPIKEADAVITYTNFAKQAILETFPDISPESIYTLDHGVDTEVFKPLTEKEIRAIQTELGWEDKFVILNVNRFQPRKLIPMTLRATALFTKGYKKCKCGNWYWSGRQKCDLNGCGPEDILEIVPGRKDALLYLHMFPFEPGMGPGHGNSLQAHAYNAGYRNEDLSGRNQTLQINSEDIYQRPAPENVINNVYNASCVNISTTVGEGFGFSLIESAASGTISIAPKQSAIPEVLGQHGHLIENIAHFNMAMDNGHVRPLVDVRRVIEALEIEYQAWVANGKKPVKSKAAVERVLKDFNWQDRRQFLENVIEEVLPPRGKINTKLASNLVEDEY